MTIGAKYGCYLKCEGCGATIDGAQVTANPEPPLTRWQGDELRKRAAERGWVSDRRADTDWCPACTASKGEAA
jgi:hypothetical protein